MIKIYGHSDDVVVIKGDITDEFYPDAEDDASYLAFSDGTVLSIQYDNEGIWRINRLAVGTAPYIKTEGIGISPLLNRPENLGTDVVTLDGDILWVLGGEAFARRKIEAR